MGRWGQPVWARRHKLILYHFIFNNLQLVSFAWMFNLEVELILFFLIGSTQRKWLIIELHNRYKIKAWQYKSLFLVLWMLKSRTMWLYSALSLRFYDASPLQTQYAENSQLHIHNLKKRSSARAPFSWRPGKGAGVRAGGANRLPRLRARIRLALSAGVEGSRRTRMEPGAVGTGDSCAGAAGAAITPPPRGPALGSPPRCRCRLSGSLVWAPEAWAGRGKWSPKRAPKRSPSILGPAPASQSCRLETEQSSFRATGVLSSPWQPSKCSVLYNTPSSPVTSPCRLHASLIIKLPTTL